jgi:putative RecB family exonuclease
MYQYQYKRNVTTDSETRALDFGRALHETIRETCDRIRGDGTYSDEELRAIANEAFQRQWQSEVDQRSYRTEQHYEDDRKIAGKAIEHFFDEGPGVDHARRSLVAEQPVAFERNGIKYNGKVDNVLETETGLELVDYKKSDIDEPVTPWGNYIEEQNGDGYRPGRVKHAIQAALYIEGIKETEYYEQGDTIAFTFQPLAETTVNRIGQTSTINLDIESISVEEDIRENSEVLWEIIENAVEGIQTDSFEPAPFEDIVNKQCDRCPFQSMCSAYLNAEEVRL